MHDADTPTRKVPSVVSGPPEGGDGGQQSSLPWSPEAEQGVLGALLMDNGAMALVADQVTEASFFQYEHRLIFGAICQLLQQAQPADVVTVFELLHVQSESNDAAFGGLKYINALAQCVPSAHNARRWAAIVAERALQRALIAAVDEAARISWDGAIPMADRLEQISQRIKQIEQQRTGPVRRVPLLSLADLRRASHAVKWLVKHVVPADSIGMLFGGSGTFKSFIALDAALHVAHGLPWMGRKTRQGPVIYIAAEGGTGLSARIEAWHAQRSVLWQGAPLYTVPVAVDLATEAWRVVDAAQLVGVAPVMVVIDTLSQTYSGEENSANEMAAYLREIGSRFRQLWGCAVLLIHHTGHAATERPRGSSAIRGNLDFMLGVFRDEKQMLATVSCAKQKDGELLSDRVFSLTVQGLGEDEDGDRVTSLVARHVSEDDEIQRLLAGEQEAGRGGRNQLLMRLVENGQPEKDLRRAFYEDVGLDDMDARKKAYYRARDWATRGRLIEVTAGVVIDLRKSK